MAKSRRRGGGNSRRRLSFEMLESRKMLSVSIELASGAAIESMSADGESGAGTVKVSGNGRYVVFVSDAHNLVSGFGDVPFGSHNLYRFDRVTGETILVTVGSSGNEYGNGYSSLHSISDDGNVVLFDSRATNLHPLDTTHEVDVFVRNISAGLTQLVNLNANGTGKVVVSLGRDPLSADGTLVVFNSDSNDLHPLDHNALSDVFVRNLTTGVIELVSIDVTGEASGNARSDYAVVSANGRMVLFSSDASNLHLLDTNEEGNRNDLYVRDLVNGSTQLVTVNAAGTGGIDASAGKYSISADGTRVLFVSSSTELHASAQGRDDLFVRDLLTDTTRWIGNGISAFGRPVMSANGRVVAYWVNNMVHTFDLESGNSAEVSLGSPFTSNSPSMSGDGSVIALDVGSTSVQVLVRNLVTGVQNTIGSPNIGDILARSGLAQISRDGSTVVFAGNAPKLVSGDNNGKLDVFSLNVGTGEVQLVSRRVKPESSSTASGFSISSRHAVSANGRYVVFTSEATNLVANMDILPGVRNVYRYDRFTGETVLVSVNVDGTGGGDRNSGGEDEIEIHASISADGNTVAFVSSAGNLDVRTANGDGGVFARDIAAGVTHLVSVNLAGTASAGGSRPLISADGNRVAFLSSGKGLQSIPVDGQQIYVRDLLEGVTRLASVAWNGVGAADRSIDGSSGFSINQDGSVVAFISYARNLHPLQTTDDDNVFVRNMETGTTYLASVNYAGTGNASGYCYSPVLSADGTSVAFLSVAGNLHPLKPNSSPYLTDAFARNLTTNETHLLSIDAAGTRGANRNVTGLSMSADGRIVTFETSASNILNSDVDSHSDVFARYVLQGLTVHVSDDVSATGFVNSAASQSILSADGSSVGFASFGAILVRSLLTGETTLVVSGTQFVDDDPIHSSYRPSLSSDGSVVAFWSTATDLVARDWNDANDVFVAVLRSSEPLLPGDYNRDFVVDSADYSVWRDALGTSGLAPYSGADGDGDGTVDQDDYLVWKANFGRLFEAGGRGHGAGSEPASETTSLAVGNSAIDKSSWVVAEEQSAEEQFPDERGSDGTRAVRWRRAIDLLGRGEEFGRARNKPPAEPGAGGPTVDTLRPRDLALLAWRNAAWARWRGSRGELAAVEVAGIHSQDADEADGVFEVLGVGRLSLLTR